MKLLDEAREEYDMIILDSCPILSAAETAILGTKVDGVLLVYRVGRVSRGLLKRSASQLAQVKCNILGVILNGMKPDVSPDFQDYKYYSYYSYGHEGQEQDSRRHERDFPLVKRREGTAAMAEEILLKREDNWLWEDGQRKTSAWRMFLLVVATAFLTAGILWQNGLLHPMKIPFLEKPAEKGEAGGPKGRKEVAQIYKGKERSDIPGHKGSVMGERPGLYEPGINRSLPQQGSTKPEVAPVPVQEAPSAVGSIAGVNGPEPQSTMDGRYPYSLYLASFQNHKLVERAVVSYKEKGLFPYWAKVDLKEKGVWFRVFAGHFEDMEEAQRFGQIHRLRDAVAKRTPYTTLIGTYANKDEFKEVAFSLEKLGYSPYAIRGDGGEYRLLAGAFITEEGAREQQLALRSSGVQSEVVKR